MDVDNTEEPNEGSAAEVAPATASGDDDEDAAVTTKTKEPSREEQQQQQQQQQQEEDPESKDDKEGATGEETTATTTNAMPSLSGKKRSRGGGTGDDDTMSTSGATTTTTTTTATVSAASAAAASQLCSSIGLVGLGSLLSMSVSLGGSSSSSSNAASGGGGNSNNNSSSLPTIDQVKQQATKNCSDTPPFVHLSKSDTAPQLKVGQDRLSVKGGMRGYRMSRASHGVSPESGNYYYEVIIQDPPPIQEIVNSLPSNVRISKKLQQEIQLALKLEEEKNKKKKETDPMDESNNNNNNDSDTTTTSTSFGSHVRLGWSMRTGDLQAPVGYDKWSYGVRDIGGSKIHCSQREDHWGGEDFGPGDVIGCAISMVPDSTMDGVGVSSSSNGRDSLGSSNETMSHQQRQAQLQTPQPNHNHIRFFKNGYPMGEFVLSKGKREGGAAFIIPDGVYYPAISIYMGANVKVNFGPYFICPPRKLPTGLRFQPVSKLCSRPISYSDAAAKMTKEKPFRKPDLHQKFLELVRTEVQVLEDSYRDHRTEHVQFVLEERNKRGLRTDDLENDDFYVEPKMEE